MKKTSKKNKSTRKVKANNQITILEKLINFALIVLFFTFGTLGVPSTDQINEFASIQNGYILIGFVFIIFVTIIHFNDLKKELQEFLSKPKYYLLTIAKYFLFAVIAFFIMRILSIFIIGSVNAVPENDTAIYKAFKYFPLYIVFVTNIYSPYVEEMIFRKSLHELVKNKVIFIVLSSVIFGLLHSSMVLIPALSLAYCNASQLLTISLLALPYVFFAGVLAYVYTKEKNIIVPICIRVIYNIIVTLIAVTTL